MAPEPGSQQGWRYPERGSHLSLAEAVYGLFQETLLPHFFHSA